MDSVYLRRLFPHDITHEVSVTGRIVNQFFEQEVRDLSFFKEDIPHRFSVDINSATDPRFGGQFKMMYANDMADVDDIL